MNAPEFIREFNLSCNNVDSNAMPDFTPYEISVFCTRGQEELLKNYVNPAGNKYTEGFDDSSKRQLDFSTLMTSKTLKEIDATNVVKFDSRSHIFELPRLLFIPINESITLTKVNEEDSSKNIVIVRQVVPITYSEYSAEMSKAQGEPLRNQAWRLIGHTTSNVAEIIPNITDRDYIANGYTLTYNIRYIRRPKPIILGQFKQTINSGYQTDYNYDNGISSSSQGVSYDEDNPCELTESMHREVIQRAVELAKAEYMSDQAKIITQMGERTE